MHNKNTAFIGGLLYLIVWVVHWLTLILDVVLVNRRTTVLVEPLIELYVVG